MSYLLSQEDTTFHLQQNPTLLTLNATLLIKE
mgnify:CR=1 FL=1